MEEKAPISITEMASRFHRHPNGGGWVENTAYVADTAYVGPEAFVLHFARVEDQSRLEDEAVVSGYAQVWGSCKLFQKSMVCGHAVIKDVILTHSAAVGGSAVVNGPLALSEDARLMSGYITAPTPKTRRSERGTSDIL
jgi:UDP-3-O-[3-hydroxymyristoyl] glucosamine N-acyltransferase